MPATSSGQHQPPVVTRKSNVDAYDYLQAPSVPMPLSYREVVLSLASTMMFTYRKFLDHDMVETLGCMNRVVRVDKRFEHHFFGLVSRQLEGLSCALLAKEQRKLAELFASFTAPDGSRGGALVSIPTGPAEDSDEDLEGVRSVCSGDAVGQPQGDAPAVRREPSPSVSPVAAQGGPMFSSFAGM
eukprot:TRINITY_DN24556_c0_g1_i2.p1 TRINITY_DN24556_c0_g1~~TRINITY_DN24556_c0_g1_i2.p1  ORF type:complete len:185 (+),score=53.12 TRINITY_DN24556_c0_g1_i2:467-1021(+)